MVVSKTRELLGIYLAKEIEFGGSRNTGCDATRQIYLLGLNCSDRESLEIRPKAWNKHPLNAFLGPAT